MAYIGRTKTPAPLTSADIPDGIVTAADLAPDSVGTSEIADSVTLVTPNLGTPSAVTLTNATFPAGHVIKTVQDQYSGGNSATLTATSTLSRVSDGSSNYNWKGTITSVAASSWVLITVSCSVLVSKTSSSDASGGIGIIRNNGSDVVIYDVGLDNLYFRSGDTTTREYKIQTGISVIDKSPDTGTNNYYLAYVTQGAAGYSIMIDSGGDTPTTFILQEIAQ